ncbi:MAG: preprotein translocase subunit SecY [Candidatus Nanoarchaeia archaeon]|nr:preprotein translocase subunit SecY [Candidatus Nanoarchaeia archaeon]
MSKESGRLPFILGLVKYLPEIKAPKVKYLSLKEKLKWTLIIVIAYFVLSAIPLFGLGSNSLMQFEYLSLVMGASFGSLLTLGIGPIVTSSIILQLLNGSGILRFDLNSQEGKSKFEGYQKLLTVIFILLEAGVYVYMGGLSPDPTLIENGLVGEYNLLQLGLFIQVAIGGFLIYFMSDLLDKWGIGSGISLFIAAGVSQTIFLRLFSPFTTTQATGATGAIFAVIEAISKGQAASVMSTLSAVFFTLVVFGLAVYLQSMKVELSLSFSNYRGKGFKWPLNFIYTSNIPVILVSSFLATVQLLITLVGGNESIGMWLSPFNLIEKIFQGTLAPVNGLQALTYVLLMIGGSVLFSIFWAQTSGMDSESQADKILKSGLQLPGFRKDKRVLKMVLDTYIPALTVLGAISVGLLASLADLTGAYGRGTGILLTVMIIYNFYEKISREHFSEMTPGMKKLMK